MVTYIHENFACSIVPQYYTSIIQKIKNSIAGHHGH